MSAAEKSSLRLLDRAEIATRITQGQQLIIYRSKVLNTTPWAPYHPGGALALLHFVGRDATDEISAYHSEPTLQRMEKFVVGRVEMDEKGWLPLTPPIALGLVRHPDGVKGHWAKEGAITLGQAILQQTISLDPSSAPIPAIPIERTTGPNPEVITLHPAQLEPPTMANIDLRKEHLRSKSYQELRQRIVDAGLFKPPGPLAGYGTDILRYLLLIGTGAYLFFKHKLYYVVLSLARFNLYANSYVYLLGPKPKRDGFWLYELAGIAFYWTYYGLILRSQPTWQMRVGYLLISHIMASPVHVQVSAWHKGI
ncbi:hypothetical protein CI109_107286 [Kwoniella shandongensis]|uniref:Delta 8-(E)-sphingolipid desaturase n=1 Tax=Kwoniella shandongensis TaxID=1734106 RepID=A0AAJ8LRK9_9TREE